MKYWLVSALFAVTTSITSGVSFAQEAVCGAAPALPTTAEDAQSVKGNLKGQADFLSKLVGKAELAGEIESAKKKIYQTTDKFFAAQKEAYLAYIFCVIIMQDKSLSTSQKLDALKQYKNAPMPISGSSEFAKPRKDDLIAQYVTILKEINKSINLRSQYVVPAINQYVSDPTPDNWKLVVWWAKKLEDQVNSAVMLSMDYDSNFIDSGSSLISFANFLKTDVPTGGTQKIEAPVFNQTIRTWAEQSSVRTAVRKVDRPPSVAQARAWSAEFTRRANELRTELTHLMNLLEPR